MELDYSPEQRALARELRAYFQRLMTRELEDEISELESSGPLAQQASRPRHPASPSSIGFSRPVRSR